MSRLARVLLALTLALSLATCGPATAPHPVGRTLALAPLGAFPIDTDAIVIGLVDRDLYIRYRADWDWAFGLRGSGRAVVSAFRMHSFASSDADAAMRLRKMVTKSVGLMVFDLEPSADPTSVLYDNILGVDDLDRMDEDLDRINADL